MLQTIDLTSKFAAATAGGLPEKAAEITANNPYFSCRKELPETAQAQTTAFQNERWAESLKANSRVAAARRHRRSRRWQASALVQAGHLGFGRGPVAGSERSEDAPGAQLSLNHLGLFGQVPAAPDRTGAGIVLLFFLGDGTVGIVIGS